MSLTKKTRFEVFKRDQFTCQYCGRTAPDVVLQVDHIEPRAKGGTDDILNLITACQPCNAGKSDRRLSDDSVVAKQHAQLADLQERQEQIKMMLDWQRSLVDLDGQEVEEAAAFWCDLVDWHGLTESGKLDLRKLIRRHGLAEVLEGMRAAVGSYLRFDDDGKPTEESAARAFAKLGGVCTIRSAEAEKPYLQDVFYIRGILKNRLAYVDLHRSKELIEYAIELGADVEALKACARREKNWTRWREAMNDLIATLEAEEG